MTSPPGESRFNKRLDQYREAGTRTIGADLVAVVEVAAKRFDLNDAEWTSVLTHLIRGGDLTQWGLANAGRQGGPGCRSLRPELESLGGTVIELKPNDWQALARYPDSGRLVLLPTTEHTRFWVVPDVPHAWPHFLASLLEGLDDWAMGFLWLMSGKWPQSGPSQSHNQGLRDIILRGAGSPVGCRGAIRFDRNEEKSLVAVLFASMAFGGCVDDDLSFTPDHAQQLVQTSHHDVVHAVCRFEARVRKLVAWMSGAGYELAAEPPDWTFKRPAWMGEG
jgi:hypothetical protein